MSTANILIIAGLILVVIILAFKLKEKTDSSDSSNLDYAAKNLEAKNNKMLGLS